MKIMQVIPTLGLAGAERMLEALVIELVNEGHDVLIVSLYQFHSSITENIESHGISVIYLNKQIGISLSLLKPLSKIIKTFNPDIIHTHLYALIYTSASRLIAGCRAPLIHTIHNEAEKESGKFHRILNKLLFKITNTTPVALTSKIRDSIVEQYGLKRESVPIVLNGINMKSINGYKTTYDIGETFKLVHVGRFADQKNHKAIVEAFAKLNKELPNSSLTFYGEGPNMEAINLIIKEKQLSSCIHIKGVDPDVVSKLSYYDAFLLPSIFEGQPITIIEAMAVGMPILTTNVGGIPDVIQNNINGLITTPDTESIYLGIKSLFFDKALREKLGISAKASSIHYSSLKMVQKYVSLYISKIDR